MTTLKLFSFFFFSSSAAAVVIIISAFFAVDRAGFSDGDDVVRLQRIPIGDAIGPESFAFDPQGEGPYTGVSDGRIIKWVANERRWIDFAFTSPTRDKCDGLPLRDHQEREHICGRPLGLKFHPKTGDLYIADAYMGLLVVGPIGGLAKVVATKVHDNGVPFRFTNSLDIDPSSGIIYFSDSSSQFQRRDHIALILSGDQTGRLMKYDLQNNRVTVLVGNLSFVNGVILDGDRDNGGDSILIVETATCRILRYWLKTSKAGHLEVFAQLPGFPDNIKRSPRGGYWVGIHSRRKKVLEWLLSTSWMRSWLLRVPVDIAWVHGVYSKWRGRGTAVRLSEAGEIVEVLEQRIEDMYKSISEVEERNGGLWIGSVNMPFAGFHEFKT